MLDAVRRDAYRMGVDEAGELLTLQYAAWMLEALANDSLAVPPLHEGLDDVRAQLADPALTVVGVRRAGRLVATVRTALPEPGVGFVGRLGVVPDLHGRGLGSALLRHAEASLPPGTARVELHTGAGSTANHRFYGRHGYEIVERHAATAAAVGYVRMVKRLAPPAP